MLFDNTRARLADFISPELAERRKNALVAAYADPLTKIGNRRALEAALPVALAEGFVVVFFDVNSFKSVNDNLGHDTGDGLLLTVAESLTCTAAEFNCLRVFRWAGDEFVCLLPADKAQQFAATAELRFDQLIKHVPEVSRLGVCISGGIGKSLKEADAAMYTRKQTRKEFHAINLAATATTTVGAAV